MEPTITTALISAGVGIVTAIVGYMTARSTAKKDIFVTDRQQLSQEQQDFRREMREELTYWRSRYDDLESKVDELANTNVKLQAEVAIWREKYEILSKDYERIARENEILNKRINELEGELRRRRKEGKTGNFR